jgi:hypothetical protein
MARTTLTLAGMAALALASVLAVADSTTLWSGAPTEIAARR